MVRVANLTRMGCKEAKDLILVIPVKTCPLRWEIDRQIEPLSGCSGKPRNLAERILTTGDS